MRQVLLKPRMELQSTVDELVRDRGMYFAHPFDSPLLMAGYGTLGLEILEDLDSQTDLVLVSCGGGGLLAGVAAAIKQRHPTGIAVVGVEPEGAPSMHRSMAEGHAVTLDRTDTFVNGLSPPYAGSNAYAHVRQYVDEVVLVTDDQVRDAMRVLYNDVKVVVENAGAAGFVSKCWLGA